jgi:hypothetical protein
MKQCIVCAALLLSSAASVQANGGIPPFPPPPPPNVALIGARNVEVVVEMDNQAKQARLQIPMNLLGGGRPRLGADAGHFPTLIAGLALTCAFVSGGFWMVRRGRGRTFAAVMLGASLLVGAASVSADLPIPPKPKQDPVAVTLPANIMISGQIVLEVVPKGDKIKLIVPKGAVQEPEKPKPEEKKE